MSTCEKQVINKSVLFQEDVETGVHLDPAIKEVQYNPTYETMFAPEVRNNVGF